MMTVICGLVVVLWVVCNVCVMYSMTVEEMREQFITEQNWIGKIGANSFYSLAWLLKGAR